MKSHEKKELLELLKKCKLPKREYEEFEKYINLQKYPKNKSDQITFYRGYGKIRNHTKLGKKLIGLGLMKE